MKRPDHILLASQNSGKLVEMRELLGPTGVHVVSPSDRGGLQAVEEDGDTLEANARKKALAAAQETGLVSLADDSGLFVEALEGRPGVHSARYGGEAQDSAANRARLLSELEGVTNRQALFRCVLALADPAGLVELFTGACGGRIAEEEHGAGGFGYDSLFVPEGFSQTFAEMLPQEKNALSHRGQALAQLREFFETHEKTAR